ncbi:MAG: diaminopimelate epimerase, partial [Lachnospiraceae bacterium]|nr:diaminopimelate epimerase [Lachnospiraceae bacterium]
MKLNFTKMEGLGNDYVYVNCFKETVDNPSELSKRVSDRHFGIGSDGLILIKPSQVADFTMEMYNADGSQSEMCGNGIRCVGKYVYDYGLTDKEEISVETLAGIKYLKFVIDKKDASDRGTVAMVTVNMGEPIFAPAEVPVAIDKDLDKVVDYPVNIDGTSYNITCISMGNPH